MPEGQKTPIKARRAGTPNFAGRLNHLSGGAPIPAKAMHHTSILHPKIQERRDFDAHACEYVTLKIPAVLFRCWRVQTPAGSDQCLQPT